MALYHHRREKCKVKTQNKCVNITSIFHCNYAIFLSFAFLFSALFPALAGCGKTASPRTETVFALDTVVQITYYRDADKNAVMEALSACKAYEKLFSRTDPESALYRLNHANGEETEVPEELYKFLLEVQKYAVRYPDYFDITLGAVSDLYDFKSENPEVPSDAAVSEALSHTGIEKVSFLGDRKIRLLDKGLSLDLGAVAKGYIGERMKEMLENAGVRSALLNLGGNVLAIGKRPDGRAFSIGIQDPEHEDRMIKTVDVSDACVVTSGNYERFFIKDGVRYHHLIDPETGRPAENGLESVTVVTEDSFLADLLSTLLFVAGKDRAEALLQDFPPLHVYFIENGELKEAVN